MTLLKGTYLFAAFVAITLTCDGQVNDTLLLSEVEIPSTRLAVYSPGGKFSMADSATVSVFKHKNIADLLAASSSVIVRDYGPGNSSLISIRGLEPRQTQVAWNGFNLNSASLGMTDASLIPVAVIDEAAIAFGTHTTTFGTSSLGGVVMLNNEDPNFNQHTSASIYAYYGSFSTVNSGLDLRLGGEKLESRTKVFFGSSENDFSFRNTAVKNEPLTTQSNSQFNYYGFDQHFSFRPGNKDLFQAGIWYQVYDRNIPPVMTIPESNASQKDSTIRGFIRYRHTFKNSILSIAGAILHDHQNYSDPEHSILADYDITSTFIQADHVWAINKRLTWSSGISVQSSSADFTEYNNSRYRNTAGVHTALRARFSSRLTGSLSFRKEYTNIEDPPLILKGEMQYIDQKKIFSFHLAGGNHFNLPTLNDLYWVPGGNPDLESEQGFTAEAGTRIRPSAGLPELSVTGFFMQVDEWIKWYPGENGIYNAENISKVRSTGVEINLKDEILTGSLTHKAEFWYTFCNTQTLETNEPFAGDTEGKQLVYVPEHTAGIRYLLNWKKYTIRYNHRFTGTQFTNPDNTSKLDPFHLADLRVELRFKAGQHRLSVHLNINNIWDEEYQVLAWHAMPGRWYQAGINLQLSNIKDHE